MIKDVAQGEFDKILIKRVLAVVHSVKKVYQLEAAQNYAKLALKKANFKATQIFMRGVMAYCERRKHALYDSSAMIPADKNLSRGKGDNSV
jgi:hypothetical protein